MRPLKPAGAVDRSALRAVATQFFVNGALFGSFVPRLPEIRDRVEISVATLGFLISISAAGGLLASAVVGRAIGRFGSRRVMLAAGTMVSLSLPIVGIATTESVLLLGLVGVLSFDVLVDVGMNMQGSWLSARRHVPVMNRLHGLWSLGTVVGGISSSGLAAAGVSLPVHLVGAGGVLLLVLGFVNQGLLRVDEHPETTRSAGPSRISPILVLFGLAGLFALAIESTAIEWAAFRFVDDLGESAGSGALGFVAVTVGMMTGRFAGDWAIVRLGMERLTSASIALSGLGLATASLATGRYLILVGFLCTGLGIATMLPMMYDSAAKHRGRPGAGLGALTAGIRTASLTVPLIVGTLAAGRLSVGSAMAVVTLPSALGFLAVYRQLSESGRSG